MRSGHCDTNMTNMTSLHIGNEYVYSRLYTFSTTTGTYSVPRSLGVGQPLINNGTLKVMVWKLSDKNEMHGLSDT